MALIASPKVGLLGGSFNPAHNGHREISLAALDWLRLDAVWWLVSPANPLKDPNSYAPFSERLAGARKVAADERIVVSDFEEKRGLQYTVDTLETLTGEFPATTFVWLMGADSLMTFHRWRDWRRMAGLAPIAVFNRPGYGDDALQSEAALSFAADRIDQNAPQRLFTQAPPAWAFFSSTDNPMSSTQLRKDRARS